MRSWAPRSQRSASQCDVSDLEQSMGTVFWTWTWQQLFGKMRARARQVSLTPTKASAPTRSCATRYRKPCGAPSRAREWLARASSTSRAGAWSAPRLCSRAASVAPSISSRAATACAESRAARGARRRSRLPSWASALAFAGAWRRRRLAARATSSTSGLARAAPTALRARTAARAAPLSTSASSCRPRAGMVAGTAGSARRR
mmetsp:Transcript_22133/g.66438  ORF Transcript_22133/g.66438 Transcript_22133/m.66438 type:complete len:203 (-) Transcript_22133:549-1157(-)